MKDLVSSRDFQNASVREKKMQLQQVNSLLTRLLEFASQIPEEHGMILLKEIQETHEFVTAKSLSTLSEVRSATTGTATVGKQQLISETSKLVRSGKLSGVYFFFFFFFFF